MESVKRSEKKWSSIRLPQCFAQVSDAFGCEKSSKDDFDTL
jgi:hypothetical protein